MDEFIKEVSERAISADLIVVSTGAGISAPSGVPTFRGKDGLWKNHRVEDLATPQAFFRDPETVWEWYNWRREIISRCEPNPGHSAIVEMEKRTKKCCVITQNVDGLHRRAGSKNIFEIHGDIWRVRCMSCDNRKYNYDVPLKEIPLRCECGEFLRPDVVWFGESLDEKVLNGVYINISNCDLFLNVGTSSLVTPASSFPLLAKRNDAFVVEINPEKTPISDFMDITLSGDSSEILPEIAKLL